MVYGEKKSCACFPEILLQQPPHNTEPVTYVELNTEPFLERIHYTTKAFNNKINASSQRFNEDNEPKICCAPFNNYLSSP